MSIYSYFTNTWEHLKDFFSKKSVEKKEIFDVQANKTSSINEVELWHLLIFIAFALSTLMQLSLLGYLSRKGRAIINWIQLIFNELC